MASSDPITIDGQTFNVMKEETDDETLLDTAALLKSDDAEHQCWSSVPVDVEGLVQEALPRLDSASRMHAARVMTMAGVQSVADLQYLKEEDFNCVLRIVHRRRLVHYFKRKLLCYDEWSYPRTTDLGFPQPLDHLFSNSMCTQQPAKGVDCGRFACPATDRLDDTSSSFPAMPDSAIQNDDTNASSSGNTAASSSKAQTDLMKILSRIRKEVLDTKNEVKQLRSGLEVMDQKVTSLLGYSGYHDSISGYHDSIMSETSSAMVTSLDEDCLTLSDISTVPAPADSLETLEKLLQAPGLERTLLACRGSSVMETVRRQMRRMLSKGLALQFSMTGLGHKRTHTKISFQDHQAWKVITDVVLKLYPGIDYKTIQRCAMTTLKNAVDWNGRSKYRKRSVMEEQEEPPHKVQHLLEY